MQDAGRRTASEGLGEFMQVIGKQEAGSVRLSGGVLEGRTGIPDLYIICHDYKTSPFYE